MKWVSGPSTMPEDDPAQVMTESVFFAQLVMGVRMLGMSPASMQAPAAWRCQLQHNTLLGSGTAEDGRPYQRNYQDSVRVQA